MSGVGRGRGWLNLKNKNTKNIATVGEDITTKNAAVTIPNLSTNVNIVDAKMFADNLSDYSVLINKVRQFNVNDDGIKFNQKIKDLIKKWNEVCHSVADVENSFEAIYQVGLVDEDFATKLVLFMACRTFVTQEICEQRILTIFVRKLQYSFENREQIRSSNINAFRNAIKMLGDFCNKARSIKGKQFSFLAIPLTSLLEMLLESTNVIDLKLFAMQLYLNGSHLKNERPEKISELLSKVRLILSSDKKLTRECKLWLILSLEVANNRFALLPADMHKFYQDQLGDEAMGYFQGTHGILTVQTNQTTESLQDIQSNVNVLQVFTPPDLIKESQSPQNTVAELNNFNGNGGAQNKNIYFNKIDNQTNKTVKAGRPILGAGARLHKVQNETYLADHRNRNKSQQQSSEIELGNWNPQQAPPPPSQPVAVVNQLSHQDVDQDSGNWYKIKQPKNDLNTESNKWCDTESSKWDNQKKTGVGEWDKKKTINKFGNKGWEHDDRFEANYS